MATVPGYKYLGPGNSINKGDPVNEVDLIAQIHDLEYTTAKSDNDIRKADEKAVGEFYDAPVSFGSLVGELGIGGKYIVESATGVLYGGGDMTGKFNIGQELYKSRQKAIYDAFRKAVHKGTHHDLQSFRQTEEYRNIIAKHKKGGEIYNQLINQSTNVPEAAPSRGSDDEPSTSRGRVDSAQESDFDWEEYIYSFIADLPDQTLADLPTEQSMDIPQAGSDRGPNTGTRSQETTSNAGGRNSIVRIPKSVPSSTTSIIFKKSRILYSYGYSTHNIQPSGSADDWITTSLALIPVDFLPFYLTHSEYTSLPEGAKIKEVTCNVYPLGTRTAFDTGTTLSGSATSEYIPIGLSAVGLNVSFYGANKKYNTTTTKPMVPNGLTNIVCKEIVKKYYDSVSSNAMCIPRSISEYWVHNWNRSKNPDTEKYPSYQVHNAGVAHMDQKVNQFLINTAINQFQFSDP